MVGCDRSREAMRRTVCVPQPAANSALLPFGKLRGKSCRIFLIGKIGLGAGAHASGWAFGRGLEPARRGHEGSAFGGRRRDDSWLK